MSARIQFGTAKLGEDGSIERIEIKFPSGYVPAEVPEKAAIRAKGGRPFIECIQWRDFRWTMVLTAQITAVYDLARMEPRAAD